MTLESSFSDSLFDEMTYVDQNVLTLNKGHPGVQPYVMFCSSEVLRPVRAEGKLHTSLLFSFVPSSFFIVA